MICLTYDSKNIEIFYELLVWNVFSKLVGVIELWSSLVSMEDSVNYWTLDGWSDKHALGFSNA